MQSRIAYPTDEGDAYGFAIRTTEQLIDGVLMKGHTGGAYGVLTAMFWQPDENWGLIIMTNGCNMGIQSIMEVLNENPEADRESKNIAGDLVKAEEHFADELKAFL